MSFLADESGAGVLEYGVILALVAMVAIAALLMLGNNNNAALSRSANSFPNGAPGLKPGP